MNTTKEFHVVMNGITCSLRPDEYSAGYRVYAPVTIPNKKETEIKPIGMIRNVTVIEMLYPEAAGLLTNLASYISLN